MKKLITQLLFISLFFGCNGDDQDSSSMCIDETLISLTPCPTVIDPVCGCDGNTYNNSCEAFNWYGVIEHKAGPCS